MSFLGPVDPLILRQLQHLHNPPFGLAGIDDEEKIDEIIKAWKKHFRD